MTRLLLPALLVASLAAPACIGGSAPLPTDPASLSARADLTSDGGRIAEQLLLVVNDLDVSRKKADEIARVKEMLRGTLATQRDAERGFFVAVADAVERGTPDVPDVRERLAMLVAAADSSIPVIERAYDDLHRVLGKKERRQVAESIRARVEAAKRRTEQGSDEIFDAVADAAGLDAGARAALLERLDAENVATGASERREQARKHAFEVTDAFTQGDFEAAKVAAGSGAGIVARARGERLLQVLASVLPGADAGTRARIAAAVRRLAE